MTAGSISSSGITASTASFTTNTLAYGHYRTTFSITDAAGNTTQQTNYFYVDQLEFIVSTGSTDIGTLSTLNQTFSPSVNVTVKTIGAGFNLSLGGSGTMSSGISELASWSGAQNKGLGFTSTAGGSGITNIAVLTPINPTAIENIAFGTGNYIGGNGIQKTYTYTIRYGAQIDSLQPSGAYGANTDFRLQAAY